MLYKLISWYTILHDSLNQLYWFMFARIKGAVLSVTSQIWKIYNKVAFGLLDAILVLIDIAW